MPLTPSMKRRIHERLQPLIGEEEADALLEGLPTAPAEQLVTNADLKAFEARFDLKLEASEHRTMSAIDQRFRQQTVFTVAMFGFMGAVMGVVQAGLG